MECEAPLDIADRKSWGKSDRAQAEERMLASAIPLMGGIDEHGNAVPL